MAKFTDINGREWTVALTIGSIADLKREANFDLGAAVKSGDALALTLFGDPEQLALVLWAMVREQAKPLDRDAFYLLLDPDSLDRGGDALMEAIVDFYHRRRAPAIKEKLPALMAKVDQKLGAAVAAAMDTALTRSAGDSPGSSASIPEG